ncbi:MAG TPA: hypothetical protein VGK18_03310 [Propionicimonas sp.]|jgi:hypothetical protein|uniref:hypothetical protein n=1 Tax=Propionicimonas sp. TaxID=1955623 RepID=UPI002F40C138
MIDLEERFRADVHQLPQTVQLDLGIDADALVASGRRVRRCRIVRRAASGVAAVLTVGLLSYGAMASRTIAGVPAPAQTASAPTATAAVTPRSTPSPSSTTRKVLPGSGGPIHFDLTKVGVVNDAAPDLHNLNITAVPDATGLAVSLVAFTAGGDRVEKKGHSDGSSPVLLQLGPKLWAGVAPDEVVAMYWALAGTINGTFWHMSGSATALIVTSDTPVDSVGAFVWRTKDGEYRDSAGNAVPSTVFQLKGRSYWFFNDAVVNLFGAGLVQPDPADGPSSWGALPTDPESPWRSSSSDAVEPGNPKSRQDSYVIGVLPVGASAPTLTVGTEVSQMLVSPLTVSGQLAFIAYGRTRTESPSLVTKVHYVDADGQQVSVPFT